MRRCETLVEEVLVMGSGDEYIGDIAVMRQSDSRRTIADS
jgi:hypothetical protein